MFLLVQIPCLNEAESLPTTIKSLPTILPGIDRIEYLVIDDGSTDSTRQVARDLGVHHVVSHRTNRGLAAAFQTGLDTCLSLGADIIVNTDADNQYDAREMGALLEPILSGKADIVVGDRQVQNLRHFTSSKRFLQRLGSAVVRKLSRTQVLDAVSGYRAISRYAAKKIFIVSSFSYTTEMIIQAGRKGLCVQSIPVQTNHVERPSRLFSSIPKFICYTSGTILRAYAMYNPLKVFVLVGLFTGTIGLIPLLRFLFFYFLGDGDGHIQSLIIGGVLFTLGIVAIFLGILADLIGRNRQLLEATLQRTHMLEDLINAEGNLGKKSGMSRAVVRSNLTLVCESRAEEK